MFVGGGSATSVSVIWSGSESAKTALVSVLCGAAGFETSDTVTELGVT